MKKIRSALRPFLAGLGIFAIVLLSIKFYTSWQEENAPKEECKQKILSVLKSPSTAQFSNFEKLSNWNMLYDVDAQNTYWAMIRSTYLCKREQLLCNHSPDLFLESMDSSERKRYAEDRHYCEKARESYQEWRMSLSDMDLLCDKFVSACEKLKNIEEKMEQTLRERCEIATKDFEEWLLSEEDLKVFCEK